MKLSKQISAIFFIWLAAIFIIFSFGFYNYSHHVGAKAIFWENLANWDGGHFLGIAREGYVEKYQYAFFPLYPILIRFLTEITHNFLVSAVIISIVSSFFAVQLLYKLVSLDFSKKLAEESVRNLLIFPTAFFLIVSYSEGLFLALILGSLYALRKEKFFWATVLAALASGTRLVGLAIVVTMIFYIYGTYGFNKKNWWVILSPFGFLAYCVFLYSNTGDPFYFLEAEKHWWRDFTIPGLGFWETLKNLATPGFVEKYFMSVMDLLMSILGVGLILRSFRFLPTVYSIYGLLSILVPLVTPSLSSMPRFLLTIFPLFVLVGLWKNEYLKFGYQILSLMLLGLFAVLFINGYWVS